MLTEKMSENSLKESRGNQKQSFSTETVLRLFRALFPTPRPEGLGDSLRDFWGFQARKAWEAGGLQRKEEDHMS